MPLSTSSIPPVDTTSSPLQKIGSPSSGHLVEALGDCRLEMLVDGGFEDLEDTSGLGGQGVRYLSFKNGRGIISNLI